MSKKCPNCGACQECGAAPHRPYPVPVYPWPWAYPKYPPYTVPRFYYGSPQADGTSVSPSNLPLPQNYC